MVEIKLKNITKIFHRKKALDNVSITFPDSSFSVLLGPPGAGKTTLLRCIAGLESPTSGRVFFNDKDVTDIPPQKRRVRMVFQSYALYPNMSVYENIAFPLLKRKLPKNVISERVNELADLLKIQNLLDRRIWQLSGGERQRVAIARALAPPDTSILVLDEPLVNLDYKLRESMRGELKRMHKELGVTIIYATPDPVDPLAMADYLAVMNQGRIEQSGDPVEVYNKPKNIFVAKYYGMPRINILECQMIKEDENLILNGESFRLTLSQRLHQLLVEKGLQKDILMGIRPEDLIIAQQCDKNQLSIIGTVQSYEVVGSDTIIYIDVGGTLIQIYLPYIYMPKEGERVTLCVDLNKIILFSKHTGRAICWGVN